LLDLASENLPITSRNRTSWEPYVDEEPKERWISLWSRLTPWPPTLFWQPPTWHPLTTRIWILKGGQKFRVCRVHRKLWNHLPSRSLGIHNMPGDVTWTHFWWRCSFKD
jgi:hypothetical protein